MGGQGRATPLTDFVASEATARDRQVAFTLAIGMGLMALVLVTAGRGAVSLPGVFQASIGARIVTALLSAYVLFSQCAQTRRPSIALLAGAFLASALLDSASIFEATGVMHRGGLPGANDKTALHLRLLSHAAFSIAVIIAARLEAHRLEIRTEADTREMITAMIAIAVMGAFATTAIVTLIEGRFATVYPAVAASFSSANIRSVIALIEFVALVALLRLQNRNVLYVWLRLAICASLLDVSVSMLSPRDSIAFIVSKLFDVVASTTIVAAFLVELARSRGKLFFANEMLERLRDAERRLADERLFSSETQLRKAQKLARLGSWELDLVTEELSLSDELREIGGVPAETVELHPDWYFSVVHPEEREYVRGQIDDAVASDNGYCIDHRIMRPDGSVRWIQARGEFVRDGGKVVRISGTALDVTERKLAEERLAHIAHHDALTQLPNRALLIKRLGTAIESARRRGRTNAVLFLDLDRFKGINDTLGHAAGDELLQGVAERIVGCVAPADTVARTGGDEFVCVLADLDDETQAATVAQRMIDALAERFIVRGQDLFITASIGISTSPSDGHDVDTLIRNADTAMYTAKESGKNTYRYFTEAMHAAAFNRLALEHDLRAAIASEDFVLHYQPIVHLAHGDVDRVEALIRWRNASGELVSPVTFIPVAEEAGLMTAIGGWAIEEALNQAAQWKRVGRPLCVAVNVSMRQLQDGLFVERLRTMLERSGADPAQLVIEVTESAAMADGAATSAVLQRCRDLGVLVALDDFGTHYSSLAYLKRLPIDSVKIDRSFVAELPHNHEDAAIVRAIVMLGRSLALSVVAEGVETAAQIEWLAENGCVFAQGFAYARPMPASDLDDWLDARSRVVDRGAVSLL